MISTVAADIEEADPLLREHRAALTALRENLARMKKLLDEPDDFRSMESEEVSRFETEHYLVTAELQQH
jgi:hypothetical protein